MDQNITWFDIVKDIVIPGLTLIAAVSIGTFIAFILKNKEEKEKRKSLLIDTYIEYLNTRVNELDNHITNFYKNILNDLLIDAKPFVGIDSNWHNKHKLIQEKLQSEEKLTLNNNDNWSFYTYKFRFLLGKQKYQLHLQKLENEIRKNVMDRDKNEEFYHKIVNEIFNISEIKEGLRSSNLNIARFTIDRIKQIVAEKFNLRHSAYFQPYDSKVSDLIEEL